MKCVRAVARKEMVNCNIDIGYYLVFDQNREFVLKTEALGKSDRNHISIFQGEKFESSAGLEKKGYFWMGTI